MDKMHDSMPEHVRVERQMLTAEVIVYAKISAAKAGMATMSLPPQCHYQLTLAEATPIRGSVPAGPVKLIIVGEAQPALNTGMALFGSSQDGHLAFTGMLVKSLADIQDMVRSNPAGWVNQGAPWEGDFCHPEIDTAGATVCLSTGRPAFACPGFTLKVEQVIPADVKEFQNPFGDGKFTVSVTNNGPKQICKALFADASGAPLFEQSLIAISEQEPHVWSQALPASIKQVEFEAGQTITGEVDTLKIQNISWPQGGMRVYFTFVLGDLMSANFFYYYSSCHDSMVEARK
eukprot:EST48185.1 hypothetical protein SS50377_11668 [Spironucleus salmonicida]